MYKVNTLPRKVLIVSDEVIAWGPVTNDPEVGNIEKAIQIAEERFVKPLICKDLYNDFRDQKNVVVTDINKDFLEDFFTGTTLEIGSLVNAIEFCDAWYQTLWTEHLWKLLSECVIYVASPTNWSKYSAAGELVNNPKSISSDTGSGGNSVDLADIKWKMDKLLMDRIDPLIASTQEYLYDNRGHFPLHNCRDFSNCCSDNVGSTVNNSGISFQRKTAWVHGLYDRINRRNCDR
jgi:hypothetical protein